MDDDDSLVVAVPFDGGPALVPAAYAARLLDRIAELEAELARLKGQHGNDLPDLEPTGDAQGSDHR